MRRDNFDNLWIVRSFREVEASTQVQDEVTQRFSGRKDIFHDVSRILEEVKVKEKKDLDGVTFK
jgi:hypothetical protein